MRDGAKERRSNKAKEPSLFRSVSLSLLPSFALSLFLCLVFSACSVPLYNVAPIPKNTPIEVGQMASGTRLEVTAAALKDDDKSFARFDANLPLAGVIAVDLKLVNHSNQALTTLKFELQDTTGRKFSYLEAKKALKAVMKFEGVQLYAIEGKQQTLAQLQAIALPKKLTLAAQEERRGVLFFQAKQDVAQLKGLTLVVKGAQEPISVPLP